MLMPGISGGGYGVVRGPGFYGAPPGYTMGMNMNQPGMMPPSYSYQGGGMGMGGYGQGSYGGGSGYGPGAPQTVDPSLQGNFLSIEASKVIARWENNKTQDDAVTDFTAAYVVIKKDRDTLTKYISSQMGDPSTAQKVQILLNFVEMKVAIQEVEAAQKVLPNLIFALTSSQTNEQPSVKLNVSGAKPIIINKDWIIAKLKQLENLLSGFSNLLNNSPGMAQNLPPELVGLDATYSQAQQIITYLHQQKNCFIDPTQAYCIAVDPKTQRNANNQNNVSNQQGGQDSQYDSNGNLIGDQSQQQYSDNGN